MPDDKPIQPEADEPQDDDVPFHLPMADDARPVQPDDDTDVPDVTAPTTIPPKPSRSPHEMPTMPIPREPGKPDPKQTVVNEDLREQFHAGETMKSPIARPEDMSYPPQQSDAPKRPEDYSYPQQQASTERTAAHSPYTPPTQPLPDRDAVRFQRPQNYPTPQGNAAMPPAPQGGRGAQRPPTKTTQKLKQGGGIKVGLGGRGRLIGCMPNGCLFIGGGIFLTFCGGLTAIMLGLLMLAQARLSPIIEQGIASIDEYEAFESTFYYDRNGSLLYEDFNEGKRVQVPLSQMPQHLIDATVALEDDSFFTNPGIEVAATTRATLQYFGLVEGDTGGSTITQQLVRNIAFDYEKRTTRSVQRKAEEIMLALALTQRLSKNEILEMYLNEIYYGNLAYGAQAAAQTIFGKDVADLSLGEAALLAGLPQAPANLDPLNPDPLVQEAVLNRWRTALDAMVREGYITSEERDATLRQGLTVYTPDAPLRAPHVTIYAQNELEDLLGTLGYTPEDVVRGGWRVFTTVDLSLNNSVERAINDQLATLTANNVTNGAVVVLKPLTGEILSMVGSADYNNDAIDGRVNVATSLRQPGSSIKPFTYAAAIENGMSPADVIWDTTMRSIPVPGLATWPLNYDRSYHGPVNMRYALANSYNVTAVQVLQQAVGTERLLAFLNRFGMTSLGTDASLYGPSLTLGGGEVSLLELTNGYAAFANQGALVPVTSILCIVDADDNILYQYEGSCPRGNITPQTVARTGLGRQVLDPRVSFVISDILADNTARTPAMGSNSPLRTDGIRSSVKTGTTNEIKDNWTVGYTRNVAVGVWVGNSNGDPMVNSSGLTGAAPIWNSVLTSIYNTPRYYTMLSVDGTHQPDQPNPPQGLTLRQVCDVRNLQDGSENCNYTQEWLLDTPAGVPNENGELIYPQQQQTGSQPVNGQPYQEEISPGVIRVRAHPIPQSIAAGIVVQVGENIPPPPSPLYCQVPYDLIGQATVARDFLFLKPPVHPADAVEAEKYARARGLAFLPTIACSPELLAAQGGPTVITAVISSPTPGQVITQSVPIMGTVQFSPDQATYYKLEILGGQFGGWTTIGSTHNTSVINGQLEVLPGFPGLQPGDYQLRLAVVGLDGNYVQEPYTIPFTVAAF